MSVKTKRTKATVAGKARANPKPTSTYIPPGQYSEADALMLMNKRYFVSREGDEVCCFREEQDGSIAALKDTDFKTATARITVNIGTKGQPSYTLIGPWWREHYQGRQYEELVFDPQGTPPHCYNHWKGLAIQPKKGKCNLMEEHILNIICSGNTEHYEYLMDLLALRFQQPGINIEVAVVLMSEEEGTGKGTLGDWVMKLIGENHAIKITKPGELVGRFTSHLDKAIFVFSDEAVWSGDHGAARTLKSLITEDEMLIEEKFRKPRMGKNRTFLLMSTNEAHAVTAGMAARRFLMLKVCPSQKQNDNYFAPLREQAYEKGGLEAFLHSLLNRDISNFNHREVPKTEELVNQQRLSLGSIDEWISECCDADTLLPGIPGEDEHLPLDGWYLNADIQNNYVNWCRQRGKHVETQIALGKRLNILGCIPQKEPGKYRNRNGKRFPEASDIQETLDKLIKGQK